MIQRLPALCIMALALAAPAQAAVPVMPFDEVRPGMRGTGRTVFEGTRIETFDVEILGKLPNVGPDQNLILARCSGGPLAETGVLAGMSGSPVTIDGKLIGAVAYSWGFSKEPIAGITPIDEMLAVAELESGAPAGRAGAALHDADPLASLYALDRIQPLFAEEIPALFRRPAGALPLAIPLAVSGLGGRGLARVVPLLDQAGFLPVQSGSAGGDGATAVTLEPGSAVGLKLVRGDVEMTATGTVTWVDGDRVLAFGHPLFGLGAVDLPMTGATVQTLLPSLARSARIATPLDELGAVRQDRNAAVLGRLGARPRLIPVRFQLTGPAREERVYSFDVADDPLLSPLLLYASLNGILASRERPMGNVTVRLKEGSVIKMAAGQDVELDNLYAGPRAVDYGTGIAAYILYLLMNNSWTQPRVEGVNLILEYDDVPRSGLIRRASLDRYRARAGETLEAAVVLSSYRGGERVLTTRLKIPEETPPGRLTLHVGGAVAVSRSDQVRDEPVLPRDLDQLIRLINQLRRNDRIYIAATREDSGVVLQGSRLPNLPPSAATVLSRPRSRGNFAAIPSRALFEETILTELSVDGLARIEFEVQAP
jgi:hypothetical protein